MYGIDQLLRLEQLGSFIIAFTTHHITYYFSYFGILLGLAKSFINRHLQAFHL